MKIMDFFNKKEVINELLDNFPTKPVPFLSEDMKGLRDPELVYMFFSEKKWDEIAFKLNLKNDSYALELGVSFLPENNFYYYIPLYIYASLHNIREFWVFESDFIQQYLCPEYRDDDDFLNFIFGYSEPQLSIMAQFMYYESEILGFSYANKACKDFWDIYL